jgi:integrase
VIIKPDAKSGNGWRARYIDPDFEKAVKVTLDPALTTFEARAAWAVDKSKKLRQRRDELAGGAVRATGTVLAEAVKRYYAAHPQLGKETLRGYRVSADRFVQWCTSKDITSTDTIDRATLATYWESLVAVPKAVPLKKGKRGQRIETKRLRGPHAINRDIRGLGTVLRFLADRDLFPRLRIEDIGRALKKVSAAQEEPVALKPNELNELLAVARKHDAGTFEMTRKDKAKGTKHTTEKYTAVYPLVRGLMMTGMRLEEGVTLEWSAVDLDAAEIKLRGATTKTKRARTIDLSVCPSLLKMLAEMRPEDGEGLVFGLSYDEAVAACKRMRKMDGCPKRFRWKALRSTCGSYLTNAPGIFGAASAYRSAKQLGHSVVVAERHYVGLVKVPKDATTLEQAMGLEAVRGERNLRVA